MEILTMFCKSFYYAVIFFVAFLHSRRVLADKRPGVINISSKLDYNITTCVPEMRNAVDGKVQRLSPNGNCVNIYRETNCHGRFIRYVPNPSESLGTPNGIVWVDEVVVKEPVHSVGPCLDACDPRNWEGAGETSTTLTLFNRDNFKGEATRAHINSDDCYALPKKARQTWESLIISGNESSTCVELHKEASCGGDFTQFRPGYPHLDELWYWGWGLGGEYSVYLATAVSRCGAFCGKSPPPVKEAPLENPGPGLVTYYDYHGYYGNARNVNLTGGCVEVDFLEFRSIRTYGQCVIFYELPECELKHGSYTLQIGGELGTEDYVEKFLTRTFPSYPRSLGLCPSFSQPVDKDMTQETPKTVGLPALPEMDQNAAMPQKGEKMLADAAASKYYPNWMIYVQPLCWLLILISGALLGSVITKRKYEKNSQGVDNEGFHVMYKS